MLGIEGSDSSFILHSFMWCAMSEEQEVVLSKQDRLALALVAGKTIRDWAQQNGVPERTAYRWASEPEVRRQLQDWRRAAIDNTLRLMAERSEI